jgi:hypothetical protein
MKIRSVALGFALASALVSTAAQANWRFTRWGMTLDQVLAAGQSVKARGVADDPGQNVGDLHQLATGETSEAGLDVEVQFYFTPGGKSLQLVRYEALNNVACVDVEAALVRYYGEGKVEDVEDTVDDGKGKSLSYTLHMRNWSGADGDDIQFSHAMYHGKPLNVCIWTFKPKG